MEVAVLITFFRMTSIFAILLPAQVRVKCSHCGESFLMKLWELMKMMKLYEV